MLLIAHQPQVIVEAVDVPRAVARVVEADLALPHDVVLDDQCLFVLDKSLMPATAYLLVDDLDLGVHAFLPAGDVKLDLLSDRLDDLLGLVEGGGCTLCAEPSEVVLDCADLVLFPFNAGDLQLGHGLWW